MLLMTTLNKNSPPGAPGAIITAQLNNTQKAGDRCIHSEVNTSILSQKIATTYFREGDRY